MSRYIADVGFIASIYPGRLESLRRWYGPTRESMGPGSQRSTLFQLEPVKRGASPFILPVFDSFQEIDNFSRAGGGDRPKISSPDPVEDISSDLLAKWTSGLHNVPAGASPGIIQIHPLPAQVRDWGGNPSRLDRITASLDEIAEMESKQTLYFEYLFQQGELHHRQNQWDAITPTMRLAAEWLGHEVLWRHETASRKTIPCPWCGVQIMPQVVVCSSCGRQVRETPPELLALQGAGTQPAK